MRLFKRGKPKAVKATEEDIVKKLIEQPKEYSRSAIGWIGGENIIVMLYRSSVLAEWQVLASRITGHNPGEAKSFKNKEDAIHYFERLVKKHKLTER